MKILTAAETREVDRLTTERHGVPSLTLMENAGKSVVAFIKQRFAKLGRRRIVILCGKGNNGGDGFVVARHLLDMGARAAVYLFAEPTEVCGDAAVNLKRWQDAARELKIVRNLEEWKAAKSALTSADIIVDALLGTGVRGPVEGELREAIEDVNRRRAETAVVAVDIPSGLSADTGEAQGVAVVANNTVTFTAPKIGFFLGSAAHHVGQLIVRDIGSPPELVEEIGRGHVRWLEPRELTQFAIPRNAAGHKGDYGHALIVAGSVGKSGAAVLASWAALRVGAGLVTVATPEPVLPIVASHTPEVMTEPLPATETGSVSLRSLEYGRFDNLLKGKRALAIGPGLSTHGETQQFIRTVIAKRPPVPIILDADGLNAFDGHVQELRDLKGMIALTPHPGEMARLLGRTTNDIQSRRLELAQKAAADWDAYVILKGHQTVVAAPNGQTWINSTGNPGMGTGGTGDVLTGMLAGLTAEYGVKSWWWTLGFGVYLHGLAGDLAAADVGQAPLIASDLIRAIPDAFQHFFYELGRG
ncbi:MAG TPA: NAD(P)H-hydrate dehydratase [Candidatus Limnocylindria bacterium]|nr:NAD(P)H-hydrate dehydratase [Candidatus Limnocylindria bacterium]